MQFAYLINIVLAALLVGYNAAAPSDVTGVSAVEDIKHHPHHHHKGHHVGRDAAADVGTADVPVAAVDVPSEDVKHRHHHHKGHHVGRDTVEAATVPSEDVKHRHHHHKGHHVGRGEYTHFRANPAPSTYYALQTS
ncbi:hypothetical protein BD309DRAFT_1019823 [Dichomitus squalens]|nr:hypothetical protein BD309DRAFT_1019823 [Dichomitus squalens]